MVILIMLGALRIMFNVCTGDGVWEDVGLCDPCGGNTAKEVSFDKLRE